MKNSNCPIFLKDYKTPKNFDDLIMVSDGKVLIGLCFKNSSDTFKFLGSRENRINDKINEADFNDLPVFSKTEKWLNIYFEGGVPDFCPEFSLDGETEFQKEVAKIMLEIPYGKTTSYGEIAETVAKSKKIAKMSAQAVGGAVGANRICLIVPCHRVIGKNGEITGFGGGINNKIELLKLENSINNCKF